MIGKMSDLKIFSNDISVNDKRIIVRLDLNVPVINSKIDDDTKIKVIEPFINKLIENKAKIVLLSHLGKPKGRRISKFSLKPILNYLKITRAIILKFYRSLRTKF